MEKNSFNITHLAVFYFNTEGLRYDLDNKKDCLNARTNFIHIKNIDKERLLRAWGNYLEFQTKAFNTFVENDERIK